MPNKIASKGCSIELTISLALTTIGSVRSIQHQGQEALTWEGDDLDDTSPFVPHFSQKRTELGSISVEYWYDPVDTNQNFIETAINAPASNFPNDGTITWSDSASTTYAFEAAGMSLSRSAQMATGLSATLDIKLTRPTS